MFESLDNNKHNETEKEDTFVDRFGFSRMLIAYMNYDNDDPKYDGYRQKESKETYGHRVMYFLSRIYTRVADNKSEIFFPEEIKRDLLAYMNYDNDDPKYDGYRQKESKETYEYRVLNSICEANRDIDFDNPDVALNIAKDIVLAPKSKGL